MWKNDLYFFASFLCIRIVEKRPLKIFCFWHSENTKFRTRHCLATTFLRTFRVFAKSFVGTFSKKKSLKFIIFQTLVNHENQNLKIRISRTFYSYFSIVGFNFSWHFSFLLEEAKNNKTTLWFQNWPVFLGFDKYLLLYAEEHQW